MGRSETILAAIRGGAINYEKLKIALPEYSEHQLHSGISYLKHSNQITKEGTGLKSVFGIPKPPIEDLIIPTTEAPKPVTETLSIVLPDFNQMFLDMVEALGDEIAAKAKERAFRILNTPELAEEFSKEFMSRFSLPVVVFNGQDATTVTFNKAPAAGSSVSVPVQMDGHQSESTSTLVETQSHIDVNLMKPPEEPVAIQARRRLPRVCVTGLKPVEAGRISQEFGETFDLVFWNDRNGDGVDQFRAHANNCEALFWHVKHGSHSNEAIARSGTAKFFRVNGDLTQMRNKLREYYTQLTAENSSPK